MTDYRVLDVVGFPDSWKGIGHGFVVGPGSDGGQTKDAHWSTVANYWPIFAHEMGHQLGLDHIPLGFTEFSPFYTSIMNYDYSYSFNGSIDNIRFSTGSFVRNPIRETSLKEVMDLPISELSFLSQEPYGFKVVSQSATKTWVDWNRDGVKATSNVRADISDGSSVHVGNPVTLDKTSTSPVVISMGNSFITFFSTLPGRSNQRISRTNVASLKCVVSSSTTNSSPKPVPTASGIGGEVSVAPLGAYFVLAYPSASGLTYELHQRDSLGNVSRPLATQADSGPSALASEPCLVSYFASGRYNLLCFNRDQYEHTINYRIITFDPSNHMTLGELHPLMFGSQPAKSDAPLAATYDVIGQKIVLVTTEQHDGLDNRLRATRFSSDTSGSTLTYSSMIWVGGGERTKLRPCVVMEPLSSLIRVYYTDAARSANGNVNLIRQLGDLSDHSGWRLRNMVDMWNTSTAGPSVAVRGFEMAFAFRWFGHNPDEDNNIHFFIKGSAIDPTLIGDYDDVTHIFTRGMKDSLGQYQ